MTSCISKDVIWWPVYAIVYRIWLSFWVTRLTDNYYPSFLWKFQTYSIDSFFVQHPPFIFYFQKNICFYDRKIWTFINFVIVIERCLQSKIGYIRTKNKRNWCFFKIGFGKCKGKAVAKGKERHKKRHVMNTFRIS